MQIYLDVCALSRPFDDQSYLRIRVETEAVNLIMAYVKKGHYKLILSPVHTAETAAIDDRFEREQIQGILKRYGNQVGADLKAVRQRTDELVQSGFGVADAAHIAFAEAANAKFITCDDRLLRICSKRNICIWSGDPVKFCVMEDLK